MEPGKFYLIASPWFWTFVGRYVKHLNFQEIVLADAIYFTRTGAPFDILARKGLVSGENGSKHHALPGEILIPAQGLKIPWQAPTPWVKK